MTQHTQHRQAKDKPKTKAVTTEEVGKPHKPEPMFALPSTIKRKELSKAAIKTCTTTRVKVKLKFS